MNKSGAISAYPSATVTADRWHHLLISVNLAKITTHGTASKEDEIKPLAPYLDSWSHLYMAFDDKNYTGYDLGGTFEDSLSDKNAVFTNESFDVAATIRTYETIYDDGPPGNQTSHEEAVGGVAKYSLVPTVPAGVIGIPASSPFVNNIYRVEMAEFMMWIGQTLDTSKEDNRRAFVDDTGKPVSPDKKASRTDPQSGSIELLGKPDVMLHKSGNWKSGNNTGTIGIDSNGKKDPDYQFVPTAKIKTYHPDPSLHGPQNPGEKA